MTLVPQEPLTRLASFERLLRHTGLSTGPDRLLDACAALETVDMASREEVRDALRAVFICRHEEIAIFDTAFDAFWTASAGATTGYGSGARAGRSLPIDPRFVNQWMAALGLAGPGLTQVDAGEPAGSAGYSPSELLRQRDFSDLGWEEMQAVRRLLRQAPWKVAERRTRRLRPDRRGAIELRRTIRTAAREGGEAVRVTRARPLRRRRPIVVICDVSGSMDRYSRELLVFVHAISRRERVEAFAFSTGLTRITHLLRHGDIDAALDHVSGQVHDIGGGTRIAEALHEFHRVYARRVLGHGAVVLLISDGWDRGDPEALGQEMARLRRSCHRLIWLNPLLGGADYRPETRGMLAALPHCDDFLPAHNVESLDQLGRLLASLPARVRRGGGGAARKAGQVQFPRPPSRSSADSR